AIESPSILNNGCEVEALVATPWGSDGIALAIVTKCSQSYDYLWGIYTVQNDRGKLSGKWKGTQINKLSSSLDAPPFRPRFIAHDEFDGDTIRIEWTRFLKSTEPTSIGTLDTLLYINSCANFPIGDIGEFYRPDLKKVELSVMK